MFPDFLCIGAQKAGTTWLHRNIAHHPDAWMPPVKEIHYFNRRSPLPLIIQICQPGNSGMRTLVLHGLTQRLKQVVGQPSSGRGRDNSLPGRQPAPLKSGAVQNLQWYLRFLLLPRNDEWYASVFAPSMGRVTGDITPYYAELEEQTVARIHALMPDAKIIYVLRNPIQRLWSQAGMRFSRHGHRGLAAASEGQIQGFLEQKSSSRASDFLRNLRTWEAFYAKRQFHIGFFDQLAQDPRTFLRDIYRFLELDASDQFIPETVHEKRNPGRYPAIPDRFARYLANQYCEQIEQLHQRFGNEYTASWLQTAKQFL